MRLRRLVTWPILPEHLPQIFNDLIGDLVCGEMATPAFEVLVDYWSERSCPCRGYDSDLFGRVAEAELDFRDPLLCAITTDAIIWLVDGLVVDS